MKEHTEQHLDSLSKKVMQSSGLETPSTDFTANIMSKIETVSIENVTTYKPLISKIGWFGIFTVIAGIIGYTVFGNVESSPWIESIDYSVISNNRVTDAISGITVSKILMYAIVFFGVAWFIQIPLMKYHFNKRLEY